MKQLLLIINPMSGTKKAPKVLADIVSLFNLEGYDVHVHVTSCRGDAEETVLRQGKGMDLIVCCGGDGTVNETVSGLIKAGLNIPVGYIPAGSTNDFANSLHLQSNPVKAAKQIISGQAHAYDVGSFDGRAFIYVASFGAFTKASYSTPQSVKNSLGHLAYILEGIQELSSLSEIHIRLTVDGAEYEDDYLFGAICNSTSLGGVINLKSDQVDLSDGKFEVLLIKTPKDIIELNDCIRAITTQTYDSSVITFLSGSEITVQGEEDMMWSLDGEKAQGSAVTQIKNLNGRIALVH